MPQYQFTQARRYDPQAIAHYYRKRPQKAIWRAITVIWSFAGFVLGDAVGQLAARSRSTPARTRRPPATNTHSLGPHFH